MDWSSDVRFEVNVEHVLISSCKGCQGDIATGYEPTETKRGTVLEHCSTGITYSLP